MPRKAAPVKKAAKSRKAAPVKKAKAVAAPAVESKPGVIDYSMVERLVTLLGKSQLTELELDYGDTRLWISKNGPAVTQSNAAPMYAPVASAPVAQAAPAAAPVSAEAPAAPSSNKKLVEITSPMVGTYYASSSPDADPYVRVGDRVSEGQTLCIIEAMKLMNEIEAEATGKIAEVCVKNAQPVEFGTVLFRIDPSA